MTRVTLGSLALIVGVAGVVTSADRDAFDHTDHEEVFPSCTACHGAAVEPGRPLWPTADDCARCHDGDERDAVTWFPPDSSLLSHVRFDHELHAEEEVSCTHCHSEPDADWMDVQRAVVAVCIDCHGITPSHLEADDDECATCHRPRAEATRLTSRQIAEFPLPPSHDDPDFETKHGALAAPRAGTPSVSASCATCHARDDCLVCHEEEPVLGPIQALGSDDR
jgi:hypothetical protein